MKYQQILLALAAVLLFSAVQVHACSCAFGGSAPCQEYWRVDAVFAGTVVSSGRINVVEGDFKYEMRLLRMTVEQPLRGMQAAEAEVVTGLGGGDCGYGFKVGQRYLVYAYRDPKDHRLETSICTRTRLLAEADYDFAFIKGLATASAQGLIFGRVSKRNYQWREGEEWFKAVADAELSIEGETTYQTRSDDKGNFRVENVLPGKYVVKLKLPPGLIRDSLLKDQNAARVENEIEVTARGCAETTFYLESDTRVSGRAIDVDGNPVPNLRLEMKGANNTFLYGTTGAEGQFEFKIVPPGDYLLGFRLLNTGQTDNAPYPRTYFPGVPTRELATIVHVKEGERVAGLELQMPPSLSEQAIEGVVVWSDGRPASGASISLGLFEESEVSASATTTADERGHFSLKLLKGLQYRVGASLQIGGGKYAQSERIEISQFPGAQQLKLVLPAQPR